MEDGTRVLSSIVSSQYDLHAKYGGVVPEIASRKHLEMMIPVVEESLRGLPEMRDIDAVAVTHGPGSRLFARGVCYAKSLALASGFQW